VIGRPTGPPTFLERLESEAAYLGNLIARRYGEAFATKEPLALTSLRDVI
jgi:hypothetical protein